MRSWWIGAIGAALVMVTRGHAQPLGLLGVESGGTAKSIPGSPAPAADADALAQILAELRETVQEGARLSGAGAAPLDAPTARAWQRTRTRASELCARFEHQVGTLRTTDDQRLAFQKALDHAFLELGRAYAQIGSVESANLDRLLYEAAHLTIETDHDGVLAGPRDILGGHVTKPFYVRTNAPRIPRLQLTADRAIGLLPDPLIDALNDTILTASPGDREFNRIARTVSIWRNVQAVFAPPETPPQLEARFATLRTFVSDARNLKGRGYLPRTAIEAALFDKGREAFKQQVDAYVAAVSTACRAQQARADATFRDAAASALARLPVVLSGGPVEQRIAEYRRLRADAVQVSARLLAPPVEAQPLVPAAPDTLPVPSQGVSGRVDRLHVILPGWVTTALDDRLSRVGAR